MKSFYTIRSEYGYLAEKKPTSELHGCLYWNRNIQCARRYGLGQAERMARMIPFSVRIVQYVDGKERTVA